LASKRHIREAITSEYRTKHRFFSDNEKAQVENTLWNYDQNRYEYFFTFMEGTGSNPVYVGVTSDTEVGALYIY
jgi:hypothetical protein